MTDARKNFAYGTVATPPSPAVSGASLILDAGQGARFPNPSGDGAFNAVVWPADAVPLASNAEVIRVTARATDTFSTILRSQEGSSARTIVAGDQVALTPTDKVWDDVEALIAGAAADLAAHAADTTAIHGIADTAALVVTTDPRLSDQRTPIDNSVTSAKIANGSVAIADLAFDPATQTELDAVASGAASALSLHEADTTSIHGIANTALLETASGAQTKADAAQAAAIAASQPLDGDLTSIAALATTSYGRSVLTRADAAALRTLAALVIGTDVQAWDSDLDAIAALTTTSIGRSLLAAANAGALRTIIGTVIGTDVQAWDADLDALAALSPSNDDVLQRKGGVWTNRSIAQLLVDLGLADAGYTTFNTDVTVSATAENAANTIVTLPSVTANGTDSYEITFYCSGVQIASVAGASCLLTVYDGAAVLGGSNANFAQWANPAAAPFITPAGTSETDKFVPTAGAHIFSIRGWRSGGNASVRGTAGGVSRAGWARIRKAA